MDQKPKYKITHKITAHARKIIVWLARIANVDLVMTGYRELGILNSGNSEKTGEKYVVEKILPKLLNTDSPILFDVGANIGEYAQLLRENFPNAKIFAFEPNTKVYDILKKNVSKLDVQCQNIGMGPIISQDKLYSYQDSTGLGTIKKEALETLYGLKEKIEEIEFSVSTIDYFCSQNKINQIDFLKIDVEGQEMEVLKGARQMLKSHKCSIIQFEFNNFNVIYRVFLKDFYDSLTGYNFYRLKKGGLVSLGKYDTINEVFKFQNILAVSKMLDKKTIDE